MVRTGIIALLLVTMARASSVPSSDDSTGAEPLVAAAVASMLSHYHYEQMPLDDRVSERWLDAYVDMLDPSRMVFLQSDVQEFQQWRTTLDDDARRFRPELEAANAIYGRYRDRYHERAAHVDTLLSGELDLNHAEELLIDRTRAPWPATTAEADELWRLRVEDQVIVGMLGGEELPEVEETLRERYARVIGDLEQNGPLDVLELYLSALGTVYDPHTLYMKPASNDNFDIEMSNSVTGIGAQLRTKGPYTVVSEVIAGGPADLDARLRAGDRIIAVAQGNADAEDIVDRRLDDVVRLIRGEKGTVVRLTVIPADATDNAERVVIDIRRDRVVLEASKASVTLHDVQGANGSSKVAVIDVPSFYGPPAGQKDGTVTDDVRALLEPLAEQGVDSVVLDMRMNGGGLLSEAIRMTGLFITSGPVVQVRDPSGDIETLSDRDRGEVAYDGPLVILTSPLSASATEIVAGALRDHGRAVVVGSETTHGKGTVQTLLDPGGEVRRLTGVNVGQDLGVVKLTVQKFYLPSGSSTQLRGVPSDIVIPSPFDDGEFSEADLDNPLPWDEVAPAKYRPMADLGPVLAELRSRSSARVAASDELRKLAEEVAEVRRLQNEPSVSLNLETRRAELEERKAKFGSGEDPEMGAFNAEDDSERPDPVLDEAVLVAADLISVAG